jgi:hypothetical protein
MIATLVGALVGTGTLIYSPSAEGSIECPGSSASNVCLRAGEEYADTYGIEYDPTPTEPSPCYAGFRIDFGDGYDSGDLPIPSPHTGTGPGFLEVTLTASHVYGVVGVYSVSLELISTGYSGAAAEHPGVICTPATPPPLVEIEVLGVSISNFTHSQPPNAFDLGKTRLNSKRGTAKISVSVPGPGKLIAHGKHVRRAERTTHEAETLSLPVVPTGKAKTSIKNKGSVKLKVAITYTPIGGAPRTTTEPLKLRARRRHFR